MARTIEKEVELLLKRQSKEVGKNPEDTLSLVAKLKAQLDKEAEKAKYILKEKEEAQAKNLGFTILKKYEVSNLEELESIITSSVIKNSPAIENFIDPNLINELTKWVDKLNAWEHSKWDNKIDYNEFYPTANRIFKNILDSVENLNSSEGEAQNEGFFG